jgi:hypothetical protein
MPKFNITDKQYVDAASRLYHEEGTIEIDDETRSRAPALVSRGDDNGAYVEAWVWVPNEEARKRQRKRG